MQQRTRWRVPHQYHGFDILNIDAVTKNYPSLRPEVLKHDVIQWLNMDEAQRAEHVAARATLQVAHTLPGAVSCATQVRVIGRPQQEMLLKPLLFCTPSGGEKNQKHGMI